MKVITITLSKNCIKNPPCSFCFVEPTKEFDSEWNIIYKLENQLQKWRNENVTVCFEYSGYNLGYLSDWWIWDNKSHLISGELTFTMTTMPEVITSVFASFLRKTTKIEAIALSYDMEKVKTSNDWVLASKILHSAGFKVSCNFLLQSLKIPRDVVMNSDQINLLTLKPSGEITDEAKQKMTLLIETLKSQIPVTTDNCLGVQLGYIDECKRGKEFVHILPDGTVKNCCFQDKCFLYEVK